MLLHAEKGLGDTIQYVRYVPKLIAAGAGPINAKFSPTRLTAWLVPTNPGGTIPRTPEKPYVHEVPQLRAPSADPYGRKQS